MQASKNDNRKDYLHKLKSTYCSACLSSDRKLSSLGELCEIYQILCNNYATIMNSDTYLCYECLALLKKIKMFQEKVRKSQEMLENHIRNKKFKIRSQSSLVIIEPVSMSTFDMDDDIKSEWFEIELKREVEENRNDCDDFDSEPLEVSKDDNFDCEPLEVSKDDNFDCEPLDVIKEDQNESLEKDLKDMNNFNNLKLESHIDSNFSNKISLLDQKNTKLTNTKTEIIKKELPIKQEYKRPKRRKMVELRRMFLNRERSQLYKLTRENFNDVLARAYTSIPIPPQEMKYWLEKERNSEKFKKIRYKCEKCVLRINRYKMEAHKLSHLQKAYTCDFCEQSFNMRANMVRHVRRHDQIRCCRICGFKSVCTQALRNHVKTDHTRQVQCLECNNCFKSTRAFYEHFREVHFKFYSIFICDYCNKKVTVKKALEEHIRKHHKLHACKECNKTFSNYRSAQLHIELKHRIERSEATYCVTCDRQFDTVLQFKNHLSSAVAHATESNTHRKKQHPCPICGKIFAKNIYMKNHYEFVHLNNAPFYCSKCDKGYTSNYNLMNHYKYSKAHAGLQIPKTKICNICGKGFGTNKILTNHIRTHTGERPHACPHCDSTFAQKAAMQTHIKNIHKKKEQKSAPLAYF